ncbi:lactate utilization protein, partial [uncultured Faecalicoccus sp.]|uniref:lactate utilization protein n=1 Tax=uncultured Faecalicoccus sp. TaxID=1971760 RepID=UPI00261DFC1A
MNPKQLSFQNTAATIIKNLKKRNMNGYYCALKEDALKKALEIIPENSSIGWGGSVTLDQIGLIQALKDGNYEAIDRMQKAPKEQAARIFNADFFLMSTNAITLDGELINVDGRANRICY